MIADLAATGAALIYFTGKSVALLKALPQNSQLTQATSSDIFNRSLRLKARHMKLCLNQRGLFTGVTRDKKGTK